MSLTIWNQLDHTFLWNKGQKEGKAGNFIHSTVVCTETFQNKEDTGF